MKLEGLEILKKSIIKQIEYDNVKIVRMEQKLKEIEKEIFELKNKWKNYMVITNNLWMHTEIMSHLHKTRLW